MQLTHEHIFRESNTSFVYYCWQSCDAGPPPPQPKGIHSPLRKGGHVQLFQLIFWKKWRFTLLCLDFSLLGIIFKFLIMGDEG